MGVISGYINSSTPVYEGLKTCAENITTKETRCIGKYEFIDTEQGTQKVKYELNVPAGEYFVYTVDDKGRRGYYTEFGVCGINVECEDRDVIIVQIKSNEIIENINTLDWFYYQNNQ